MLAILLDALSDRWGLLMATILLALAACASVIAAAIVYVIADDGHSEARIILGPRRRR